MLDHLVEVVYPGKVAPTMNALHSPMTSDQVYLAVRERPDAIEIMKRLSHFDERIKDKGEAIDALRRELEGVKNLGESQKPLLLQKLTIRAGFLSEELSRIEAERDTYVHSVLYA